MASPRVNVFKSSQADGAPMSHRLHPAATEQPRQRGKFHSHTGGGSGAAARVLEAAAELQLRPTSRPPSSRVSPIAAKGGAAAPRGDMAATTGQRGAHSLDSASIEATGHSAPQHRLAPQASCERSPPCVRRDAAARLLSGGRQPDCAAMWSGAAAWSSGGARAARQRAALNATEPALHRRPARANTGTRTPKFGDGGATMSPERSESDEEEVRAKMTTEQLDEAFHKMLRPVGYKNDAEDYTACAEQDFSPSSGVKMFTERVSAAYEFELKRREQRLATAADESIAGVFESKARMSMDIGRVRGKVQMVAMLQEEFLLGGAPEH